MRRIKILLMLMLVAATVFAFASCGNGDDSAAPIAKPGNTVKLNVYNWGEYISDGSLGTLDVNKEFEKYYFEKYGQHVEVVYSTYPTNEDMYSKLKNGTVVYDIVIPSDYMIEKMIAEGMLLEYNVSEEIENYGNISDSFKNSYYDPTNTYSVPYTYGMVGVIYNKDLVDPEDYEKESWSLLWNAKYRGKILQFNNPRDAFATAMYYKGYDINSTDKADWDAALEILKAQKPLVQGYVNDEIFNKMTTASAAIATYYAGDYITMADQNESLGFYYPKEGCNYFVDAMCIPKNAAQPEIAKEYINFMLTEAPAVANALYIGYASPNELVKNSEEYAEEMGEEAMDILYGVAPDEVNASYIKNFGTPCYKNFTPEIQSYTNTLWETLKTENATELWVHITTGVIVAAVLTLAIYTTYIKKKRSRDYRLRDKAKKMNK